MSKPSRARFSGEPVKRTYSSKVMPLAKRSAVTTMRCPPREACALRRRGPGHGGHAAVELFRAHVFLVGREMPVVAEWILEAARAVAVELVGHWPRLGCARRHGLAKEGVDVVHVEQDAHGRASVVLGAERLDLGMLVGEHDDGVADLDLSVPDPVTRGRHAHELLGVEGARVKVEGLLRAVYDQIGRRAVISLGNLLHFGCVLSHGLLLSDR